MNHNSLLLLLLKLGFVYLHLTLFLWFFSLHSQFVELVPTSYGNTYSKIFPADRWDVIWTSRHFWEDGPGREKNRPTVFVMPFLICTHVSMIQCLLPILAILHSTGSFSFAVIGTHVCFPEDNSLVGIQWCCYDDDLWTMWQSWPSASLELLMDQKKRERFGFGFFLILFLRWITSFCWIAGASDDHGGGFWKEFSTCSSCWLLCRSLWQWKNRRPVEVEGDMIIICTDLSHSPFCVGVQDLTDKHTLLHFAN